LLSRVGFKPFDAGTPPLALRVLTSVPGFQQLTGRFIGMGLQPQHIKKI